MKTFVKGLESETQILVGIGSAIAAGCIPCLENIYEMAQKAGITETKIKSAAVIGQFVKDQPVHHMKVAADNLLGTHLQRQGESVSCPAEECSPTEDRQSAATHSQQSCTCTP